MKYFTSYFYQIRFFKPYMIPLSTAVWDPKWFHDFRGQDHMFIDKHGVINGLRVEEMAPGFECRDLCRGPDNPQFGCNRDPTTCEFLRVYYNQLCKIDIDDFNTSISALLVACQKYLGFEEEPQAIFIVHEAISNPCSERITIQRWLNEHGNNCVELSYPIK